MQLFFLAQSQRMAAAIHSYGHNESVYQHFLKSLQKRCFQNGNTTCEHKFQIKNRPLTGLHKIFWN